MDCELVSERQSRNTGSDGEGQLSPRFAYSKIFHDRFPYYLAMGMTYEQYWQMDCALVKDYRKAAKLRAQQRDEDAWIHGAYIYDALVRVAPIYHTFAKRGTKPEKYPDRPYSMVQEEKKQKQKSAPNKDARAQALFESWMIAWNQKIQKDQKGGGDSG